MIYPVFNYFHQTGQNKEGSCLTLVQISNHGWEDLPLRYLDKSRATRKRLLSEETPGKSRDCEGISVNNGYKDSYHSTK